MRVLEVGCGTGAVLNALRKEFPERIGTLIGVDIDGAPIKAAGLQNCCQADGVFMPFPSSFFDLVYCHYLLLWTQDPVSVLREMRRVTAPGGFCAAMAEPCYADMQAYPEELADLTRAQRCALRAAGADLNVGRMLEALFRKAGFSSVEQGRYQTLDMNQAQVLEEIRQMQEDSGNYEFIPQKGVQYSYNVPTYFAYAIK